MPSVACVVVAAADALTAYWQPVSRMTTVIVGDAA